ncbi:hypothetical protein LTR08_008983 [Meristemomyces frigidus]|nr:hypothetical protein LTR08_008983 [Meristemomyces frigidus]
MHRFSLRHTMPPLLTTTLLLLLLLSTSLLTTAQHTYPPPGACTGNCTGSVHDPSVVRRADGTYFRFTTNGRINIATAPSIAGPWTYQGCALPHGSRIALPGRDDLWAPDVLQVDGVFFLTYSVSAIGSRHSDIGVATSETMEAGTWTDHGSIGVPDGKGKWNRIDSNLLQLAPTQPATVYLTWGSFWTGIHQTQMLNPPLRVLNPNTSVHLEQNTTVRPQGRPKGASEGSYQFRWTLAGDGGTWIYLFFSSGGCCNIPPHLAPPGEEYKIMVCRSLTPTGPFFDREGRDCVSDNGGTLVLGSHGDVFAPGGQGVMFDEGLGGVVVYYHYVRPSVGYGYGDFVFGWNGLDFGSGWPVVVALEDSYAGTESASAKTAGNGTSGAAETGSEGVVATESSRLGATSTLTSGGARGRG